jgi:hypothetical protein
MEEVFKIMMRHYGFCWRPQTKVSNHLLFFALGRTYLFGNFGVSPNQQIARDFCMSRSGRVTGDGESCAAQLLPPYLSEAERQEMADRANSRAPCSLARDSVDAFRRLLPSDGTKEAYQRAFSRLRRSERERLARQIPISVDNLSLVVNGVSNCRAFAAEWRDIIISIAE